jgi:multidrug resistance efflux pump
LVVGERWESGYRELGHQALVESAWVAFDSESIPISSRLQYGNHRTLTAQAQLKLREAELARLLNGSREQERREALAAVKESEAVLANAKAEERRKDELYRVGVISKSEADLADREYGVAKAQYDAAREHHAFVDATAREDDRKRAEAEVMVARAQIAEAKAMLEKTGIRSPIDGVILRKHMHAGETISDLLQSPIYTLADLSVLRVRVDVDERDISKIRIGQRAWFQRMHLAKRNSGAGCEGWTDPRSKEHPK